MDEKNEDSPEEIHQDKSAKMEYEMKDPETGKVKRYEISYSQKLQEQTVEQQVRIEEELKKSNRLKKMMILFAVLFIIALALVWFNTGTIGQLARIAVCP